MITLMKFHPAFGLPDPSPFCSKVEVLLQMANLAYTRRPIANPGRAPKGKLPAIVDDGETIPDSELIRWHLERKYGVDFDAGLSPVERARGHAYARMLEERTYWAIAATRWLEDRHWATTRDGVLGFVPAPVRPVVGWLVRRDLRKRHWAQGMGRHSAEDRYAMAIRDIDALAAELGEKEFMLGPRPTALDATAYPFLSGIADPPFPSPAVDAVRRHPNLLAYMARMKARFFAS